MPATARIAERAAAAGLAGAALLNEPLIGLARGWIAGLPGLYVYVFAVWALLILAIALAMRRGRIGGG